MKIRLAGYAGFCSGVTKAVEMVLAESGRGAKVSTLGPLVHNEAVMQRLQASGVEEVGKPEAAVGGVLVIRTHGAPPRSLSAAGNYPALSCAMLPVPGYGGHSVWPRSFPQTRCK